MKVLGIIAEYNPFHNGHEYHIRKSKELTGADCTVAVMSGNFTQRGEAAVFDKWQRSRAAVESGVDLAVELPFVFACNRGEIFAKGAVDILKGLGVTHISFGSECGKLDKLEKLAFDMERHKETIERIKNEFMESGNSFAKSFHMAVESVLGSEQSRLMTEPNNILALEYIKRIFYWRGKGVFIEPVTVKRYGSGYFEADEESGFAGATFIRKIMEEDPASALKYVPESMKDMLAGKARGGLWQDKAFDIIRSDIIRSQPEELRQVYCMGEGLEYKFKKEVMRADSFEKFLSSAVSKRYTEAAIRRILTYILVGLKEENPKFDIYARLLAAGKKGRDFIKSVKKEKKVDIPFITNINKEKDDVAKVWDTLQYDCVASDMYNILMERDLYEFSDRVRMPYVAD